MTQPTQEGAVGESNTVVDAAEPSLEDRFAALAGEEQVEEEEDPQATEEVAESDEEQPEDETEVAEEGVAEVEAEELPPIDAPVSWTAEEKEEFKSLPRALQETLTRREAEREKFVQSKAQEAKQARSTVEKEALAAIQQIEADKAEKLAKFEAHFDVPEPDPRLIVEDPERYAAEMQRHRYFAAQREQAQQQANEARQRAAEAEKQQLALAQQEFREILSDKLPEFFDAERGPALQKELGAIAQELGYSAEQLNNADAYDILAMKKVSDYKAKAAKYDALMSKQMEKVRAAKDMPKVSKPGVPAGKGQVANSRYAADRQAMKSGDTEAAKRVFSNFI